MKAFLRIAKPFKTKMLQSQGIKAYLSGFLLDLSLIPWHIDDACFYTQASNESMYIAKQRLNQICSQLRFIWNPREEMNLCLVSSC